jgi:hypothetical protein
MDSSVDAALARWSELRRLVAVTDPPWRFMTLDSGVVTGTRAHSTYVEALWVVDETRAGVSRGPIPNRPGPPVVTVNFAGPLRDAVEILQRPARPEQDP